MQHHPSNATRQDPWKPGKPVARRIARAVDGLGVQPAPPGARSLVGYPGLRRFRSATTAFRRPCGSRGYAKTLEEHPAVAELELIDRTIREPDERRPDPRPGRERFFRREGDLWVLAVVDFDGVPAIIVTVFSTNRSPI